MAKFAAKMHVPTIIMHSLSSPETMQINPVYKENIVDSVYKDLCKKIQKALKTGIKPENIIIDPGIGFGKTFEHNIELIKRIREFKSMGYPVLIGISRKSFISKILGSSDERYKNESQSNSCFTEEATIALNSFAVSKGVNIIRVHDVYSHYKALKVLDKVMQIC